MVVVAACTAGCGRVGFDAVDGAAHGTSLCDAFPDALWCNDFETGELLGAEATPGNAGFIAGGGWENTAGYEVSAAAGDVQTLKIRLPATVTSGPLHIGGRMFFEAGPQTQSYVVIAQALSAVSDKISFDLNSLDRVQLVNTMVSGVQGPQGSFPRGTWSCFELGIVVETAGGSGRGDLLLDGAPALAAWQGQSTSPPDGFSTVEVGAISSFDNPSIVTVRFDNLIVRRSAIGCP